MGFLSWIAEWAEKIPIVGSHIAELVRKIEKATEDWLDYPLRWLWFLKDWYSSVAKVVDEFVRDPVGFISKAIPDWVKSGIRNALNAVGNIKSYINTVVVPSINNIINNVNNIINDLELWVKPRLNWLFSQFDNLKRQLYNKLLEVLKWVDNAKQWLLQQIQQNIALLKQSIWSFVKPVIDQVQNFIRQLELFAKDPVGFIKKAVGPVITPIVNTFNSFRQWVTDRINGLTAGVLHIDDFLKAKLQEFIFGLIAWFIWSLMDDLRSLEYDMETGEIIGEPKNPVTKLFVTFYTIGKPKYEYKSVQDQVV